MKKNLSTYIFLYYLLLNTSLAQSNNNTLFFNDGVKIDNLSELIYSCAINIPNTYAITNHSKIETCSCALKIVAKNYTSIQYALLMQKYDNVFTQLIVKEGSNEMLEELETCISANLNSDIDIINSSSFNEDFLSSCIYRVLSDSAYINANINAVTLCICMQDKLSEKGFTINQFKEMDDDNSVFYNETIISCLNQSKPNSSSDKSNDIVSVSNSEKLDLIRDNKIYKLKVKIGNIEKYFIFDSGASDVTISEDFENELVSDGVIKKSDYIEDGLYELADGAKVRCRRVLLNNLQVGGFIINNVTVAINKTNKSPLLGKSILDKFNYWTIDNAKSTLLLVK